MHTHPFVSVLGNSSHNFFLISSNHLRCSLTCTFLSDTIRALLWFIYFVFLFISLLIMPSMQYSTGLIINIQLYMDLVRCTICMSRLTCWYYYLINKQKTFTVLYLHMLKNVQMSLLVNKFISVSTCERLNKHECAVSNTLDCQSTEQSMSLQGAISFVFAPTEVVVDELLLFQKMFKCLPDVEGDK